MERTYTVGDLEGILHLSKWTIQKFIREGKLHAIKAGRAYVIPESSLQAYLNGSEDVSRSIQGNDEGKEIRLTASDYEALKGLFATIQGFNTWNPMEQATIKHLESVIFPNQPVE